jgi:hypothetical protein
VCPVYSVKFRNATKVHAHPDISVVIDGNRSNIIMLQAGIECVIECPRIALNVIFYHSGVIASKPHVALVVAGNYTHIIIGQT